LLIGKNDESLSEFPVPKPSFVGRRDYEQESSLGMLSHNNSNFKGWSSNCDRMSLSRGAWRAKAAPMSQGLSQTTTACSFSRPKSHWKVPSRIDETKKCSLKSLAPTVTKFHTVEHGSAKSSTLTVHHGSQHPKQPQSVPVYTSARIKFERTRLIPKLPCHAKCIPVPNVHKSTLKGTQQSVPTYTQDITTARAARSYETHSQWNEITSLLLLAPQTSRTCVGKNLLTVPERVRLQKELDRSLRELTNVPQIKFSRRIPLGLVLSGFKDYWARHL